eukprot:UN12788
MVDKELNTLGVTKAINRRIIVKKFTQLLETEQNQSNKSNDPRNYTAEQVAT